MKTILVKDLLIPLKDCAAIDAEASLSDAALALTQFQPESAESPSGYSHPDVLVYGKGCKIFGKINQTDLLRGLEPRYNQPGAQGSRKTTGGFSRNFLRSLIRRFSLWDKPLEEICRNAAQLRVKDCTELAQKGEYVEADDTLDVAVNQLVLGRQQSLLVTQNKQIIGILRLADVFQEVCDRIKNAASEAESRRDSLGIFLETVGICNVRVCYGLAAA